jgi:hypothetical protein
MLNNGAPTLLPTQEDLHSYAANVPINRMGTPEDVAKWLFSSQATRQASLPDRGSN